MCICFIFYPENHMILSPCFTLEGILFSVLCCFANRKTGLYMLQITLPWDDLQLFKLESLAISDKYWDEQIYNFQRCLDDSFFSLIKHYSV